MRSLVLALLFILCGIVFILALPTRTLDFAPLPESPIATVPRLYGLNANGARPMPWLLNFGVLRFWDDAAQWWDVEPQPGKWHWQNVDFWVETMNHLRVREGLFELGKPPKWARGTLGQGTNSAWRIWVRDAGQHLQQAPPFHVTAWSPYNEFTYTAGGWKGTNEQMVRLSEDARCILTGRGKITMTGETCAQVLASVGLQAPIDPTTVMLSPSFGFGNPKWKTYFATAGAMDAAEGIEFHCYNPDWKVCVNQVAALKKYSPKWTAEAIWLGEISWSKPGSHKLSWQQKAEFTTAIYTQIEVRTICDYAYNNLYNGELMLNGKLTPAGEAYKALTGPSSINSNSESPDPVALLRH